MTVCCEICYEPYHNYPEERRPRALLPCGHDFCTGCLKVLVSSVSSATCPKCRCVVDNTYKRNEVAAPLSYPVIHCLLQLEQRLDFTPTKQYPFSVHPLALRVLETVSTHTLEGILEQRHLTQLLDNVSTDVLKDILDRRSTQLLDTRYSNHRPSFCKDCHSSMLNQPSKDIDTPITPKQIGTDGIQTNSQPTRGLVSPYYRDVNFLPSQLFPRRQTYQRESIPRVLCPTRVLNYVNGASYVPEHLNFALTTSQETSPSVCLNNINGIVTCQCCENRAQSIVVSNTGIIFLWFHSITRCLCTIGKLFLKACCIILQFLSSTAHHVLCLPITQIKREQLIQLIMVANVIPLLIASLFVFMNPSLLIRLRNYVV